MNRQIALIDDQLDVFDALADLDEIAELAVEATVDAEPVDAAGNPVLFALPTVDAAPAAEQMTIALTAEPAERVERYGSTSYAVRVDADGMARFRPLPAAAPVVFAYVAVVPDGSGANVYVEGEPCRDCDDITIDPMRRRAVPCCCARRHAERTVERWGAGARLVVAAVPAGDLDDMVAAARRAVA